MDDKLANAIAGLLHTFVAAFLAIGFWWGVHLVVYSFVFFETSYLEYSINSWSTYRAIAILALIFAVGSAIKRYNKEGE